MAWPQLAWHSRRFVLHPWLFVLLAPPAATMLGKASTLKPTSSNRACSVAPTACESVRLRPNCNPKNHELQVIHDLHTDSVQNLQCRNEGAEMDRHQETHQPHIKTMNRPCSFSTCPSHSRLSNLIKVFSARSDHLRGDHGFLHCILHRKRLGVSRCFPTSDTKGRPVES